MRMSESSDRGRPRADALDGSHLTRQFTRRDADVRSTFGSRLELAIAPAEARALAKEAYIYGLPLVENYRLFYARFVDRTSPEFSAPWNQIVHEAPIAAHDPSMTMPNLHMLSSHLGADLRAEPLVLTMPAVEDRRYYSAQFVDMHTFNFAYVGSRATGRHAAHYLIAGPRWKGTKPQAVAKVIRCETDLAYIRFRTQLFAPHDIANVERIQSGYVVQPLSSFLGLLPAPAPPRLE